MKAKTLIIFIFFCKLSFAQSYVKSLHNSREISITISCTTDSIGVFLGNFERHEIICCGNVVHVNLDKVRTISKQDSLIKLDFSRKEGQLPNEVMLIDGETLKIRLIKEKGLRIPKRSKLKIYLTIDGKLVEIVSKRYKGFCHSRNTDNCWGYKLLW